MPSYEGTPMTTEKKALAGIRVLDLSRVMAGPTAAQTLADLGADVIKIERPVVGDDTRSIGPYFPGRGSKENRSSYFWSVNRGKRSIAIDVGSPEGADLVRQLAAKADVLIENFKTGTLTRYGLGHADLAKIKPGLVYCSITGFGQDGPYRNQPGYDTVIQAMGGLMSLTGHPDNVPGGGPMRAGLPLIDIITSLYATTAILAALRHRDETGEGQFIDLGLLDAMVASLSNLGVGFLNTDILPQRVGIRNNVAHPSGVYACADGQVMILVGNDGQFQRLAKMLNLPEMLADERFASNVDRVRHADEIDELISAPLKSMTQAECVEQLNANNVPGGPINDMRALFADPHVVARGDKVTLHHPSVGDVNVLASPMKLSATPVSYDQPAPALGEHTREIMTELLGLDAAAIDALTAKGIVQ